ncbi:MAG: two-component sensor histidine kinase, partial [Verrucomicrobia bacterium]|nr:two-component sensor histidine kinase [Cytophagales bacterium]
LLNKNGVTSNWKNDIQKEGLEYTINDVITYANQHHLENLIAIDNTASATFVENYGKLIYKTDYENLYFSSQYVGESVIKQYVGFIKIDKNKENVGYVVIHLRQKRSAVSKVFPELLLDKESTQISESQAYSYAVLHKDSLIHHTGNLNFNENYLKSLLPKLKNQKNGIIQNAYHYSLIQGKNKKQVVVASQAYPWRYVFSNMSFLFLLLVLVNLGIIIFYNAYARPATEITAFSTRIQIYLNLAFFLPLFLVSIVMFSRIISANKETQSSNFMKKARSVSDNIATYLDRYYEGDLSKDSLSLQLAQLSKYSEADVNLYDKDGILILSNQPLIYEKEILSKSVNPKVMADLAEKNNKEILLAESVGNLQYNAVYVGIKGQNTERLGIVSIPFFTSQADTEKQIAELLATIMNIFTALFVLFLLLSYFASRILTIPLRLIAQKLKQISLKDYNEPLQWQSEDEIGLLVSEYNKMLVNLEESKRALSQSEKESAWREMAQQVAHEIKNPLTPMKLTLQHLQRTQPSTSPFQKSFETLLEQVENLSEIAGSFSDFAKMPLPKEEIFDITAVLRQTAALYASNPEVVLYLDLPETICLVKADDQLMSRIFTNIILNGIQSVPKSRQATLQLNLTCEHELVLITIQDNGSGIPEAIQEMIFTPRFTTKFSGSGIGLALAKHGIEQAGGKLWFETEIGKGTSFFIQLPSV